MSSGRACVVGVAIVRDGRLLAARRTRPAAYAGLWELPGGKVEPDETLADAAVREVREELGCAVAVERTLSGAEPIDAHLELRVVVARLTDGEPRSSEHDALRWLGPDELTTVPWPPADLPFLPGLADVLRGGAAGPGLVDAP